MTLQATKKRQNFNPSASGNSQNIKLEGESMRKTPQSKANETVVSLIRTAL
jgi:hypothetical protein